ncbi:hypothetical protein SDC9_190485 [bioreactor metagenome]|uniref:Uncharacterized protein n=1 Tax=bioreactor metagenome TaxID=1076179 RepID=A0A645HVC3_9ZZZZ
MARHAEVIAVFNRNHPESVLLGLAPGKPHRHARRDASEAVVGIDNRRNRRFVHHLHVCILVRPAGTDAVQVLLYADHAVAANAPQVRADQHVGHV